MAVKPGKLYVKDILLYTDEQLIQYFRDRMEDNKQDTYVEVSGKVLNKFIAMCGDPYNWLRHNGPFSGPSDISKTNILGLLNNLEYVKRGYTLLDERLAQVAYQAYQSTLTKLTPGHPRTPWDAADEKVHAIFIAVVQAIEKNADRIAEEVEDEQYEASERSDMDDIDDYGREAEDDNDEDEGEDW